VTGDVDKDADRLEDLLLNLLSDKDYSKFVLPALINIQRKMDKITVNKSA
jgi:hypothetical protein